MADITPTTLRALVLDDDAAVATLLTALLADIGIEVHTCPSVAQAKERVSTCVYDLLLLDKNLPDGNGLDVAAMIASGESDAQVFIMTAEPTIGSAVAAVHMQVADYLLKPFADIDDVVRRVRRGIEHQRTQRDRRALLAALEKKNRELESLTEQLHRKNEQLEGMVVRDALTGLFNHAFFQERLGQELASSARYSHDTSLVFLDIDNFKHINDNLGHQMGDRALTTIADVLRGQTRVTDNSFRLRENDLAARYGGDEFVILMPQTPKRGAAATAERLRAHIERHCDFGSGVPRLTVSVGVASCPEDARDRDALIHTADTALYAAKRAGRNRVMSYTPELEHPGHGTEAQVQLIAALRQALDTRAFAFDYRPIMFANENRVAAYEALCRPVDPAFPSFEALLGAAENAGQVLALGRVVRELALSSLHRLAPDVSLCIGVHELELYDPQLIAPGSIERLHAQRVVLQIPEPRTTIHMQRLRDAVTGLRLCGFRIALDGLGTGYAGLQALAGLQPDYVRLERGMLAGLQSDKRAARLVRHVLDFAANEGITVIGAGVETLDQLEVARALGCPLVQGPYFAAAAL